MTSYPFFKMVAASYIGFDLCNVGHPRIVGPSLVFKFGLDRICSFSDIAIFIFRCFDLKLHIHAIFGGVG